MRGYPPQKGRGSGEGLKILWKTCNQLTNECIGGKKVGEEYTLKRRRKGFDLRFTGQEIKRIEIDDYDPNNPDRATNYKAVALYRTDGGTFVLVQIPLGRQTKFYILPDTIKPQKMFFCASENDLREKLLKLVGKRQLPAAKELLDAAGIEPFNRIDDLKLRYVAEVSKHDKAGNIQEFKMYETSLWDDET